MNPERWQRIDEVFRSVVDRPPGEQADLLERACGGETWLRQEVERLLAAHEQAGDFLEEAVRTEAEHLSDDRVGTRIGAYEVIRSLGHGGMGTVYLAERADRRYHKEVAVKVIKRGMDTEEIQRRFRQERQILASLDHPNIARLLDAATTDDGLPCFVMEYAPGLPIDRYCDAHALSVTERLELVRTVCSAVQEAHRNLVVHRDLKPSNILVTDDGVPKLLDFGIAKILDPDRFAQSAVSTAMSLKVMTPDYASPEQVRGEKITTASDVYSLGVVLYVLLTGQPPYRVDPGRTREMERVVCEQEPVNPSRAVGREKLRRRLAGDLDTIVLAALRKEPRQRYSSVERLSEDLRRHLEGLPVKAQRPTLAYRTGKFIRRHRAGVAAAALSVALLAAGVSATMWQAREAMRERSRAEAERDRAEEVTRFLEELFQMPNPSVARGNAVTARELLDKGAEDIRDRLRGRPEVQARLMDSIGRSFQGLGLYDSAIEYLEEALRIRSSQGDTLEVAEIRDNLAGVYYDQDEHEKAEPLFRQTLATRRRLLGETHPLVAESLSNTAAALSELGDDAAEPMARRALAMKRRLLGNEHADVATSLNNLAVLLMSKGDLEAAQPLFEEALASRRRLLGEDAPEVAESLNNVGAVLYLGGDPARAEPLFHQVLALRRQALGEEHPDVAQSLNNLAKVLVAQEDYAAAEPLFRQALDMRRRLLDEGDTRTAGTLRGLVSVLEALGRYEEAEALSP